ncbi:hypothetical protein GCM10009593_41310 [Microlunatus antarcticus]
MSAPGPSQGAAKRMTTNAEAQDSTVTTTATTPARPSPEVVGGPEGDDGSGTARGWQAGATGAGRRAGS